MRAVCVLQGGQDRRSNLDVGSAVAQLWDRIHLCQVYRSYPLPARGVVDACSNVLWKARLYLCS